MEVENPKFVDNLVQKAHEVAVSEIPAKSYMNRQVTTVHQNTNILATIKILNSHKISYLPVLDNSNRLVGIITEHDLLIQASTHDLEENITFTKTVISARPDTPLKEVLVKLYKNKIHQLPVVDKSGLLLGIITQNNVLNTLIEAINEKKGKKEPPAPNEE